MSGQPLDFSKLPDVSKEHPELDEDEQEYAAHMRARENAFEAIFGDSDPPNQILSPDDADLTVNWPGGGVYRYPARDKRRGVHYVTFGLSQPFGDDDEDPEDADDDDVPFSGFGIELVLSTPDKCDWAPLALIQFVKYLLFDENARLFIPGHRIPASVLRQVNPSTELTHFFGITSAEYSNEILLPAGLCTLVHLVGATSKEIELAKQQPGTEGTFILAETLRALGVGYVTDVSRRCATTNPQFEQAWEKAARDHVPEA